MNLLTVEAARARILARAAPLGVESVLLAAALGRVLAAPVIATRDQPPFAASAMDGWAVRSADAPARLTIVGESAAGHGFAGQVGSGQAVRIFTGAPLPQGADAVVIQEDAARDGNAVSVPAVAKSRHVRAAGLDFRAGDRLLEAGIRLDAWRLALAAAAGAGTLEVYRRARVVVMATGDEIVSPGETTRPDQIFDSGSIALASLIRSWGGQPETLTNIGDDEASIAAAVAGASGDLIVTLGGASVGDYDLVKPALAALGLTLEVASIAMRPGKPTWFGRLADGRPVLGLSGNPASALVCAEVFLQPLLAALHGADTTLPLIAARTTIALAANGEREHWLRARMRFDGDGEVSVAPFTDQDSSLVSVFAAADSLVRRRPLAVAAEPGDIVEVLPLSRH